MVQLSLPYGNTRLLLEIPNEQLLAVGKTKDLPGLKDVDEAIRISMKRPIGTKRLSRIAGPGDTAAIVVNDVTRPLVSDKILSHVLEELKEAGVRSEDVAIIVATGIHRANTSEEHRRILGDEIWGVLEVINHDPSDENKLTHLGTTRMGVPVKINKVVADAKIKILTGLIAPHQSAGYSGGRKSVLPGVASYESIKIHHSFPIRPREPAMGKLGGNPFHEAAMEAARMAGVDFIVNVVLNTKKEIVKVVAGDVAEAWMEGVKTCTNMCRMNIPGYADITIASPGGYPRDINLWQAQKAVSSAELVTKPGGVIILVAQCAQGLGEEELRWFDWLMEASTPEEVIDRFRREGFTYGSNKSYLFARALRRMKLMVVTEGVSEGYLGEMFMKKYGSVEEALKDALGKKGEKAKITVMPHAVNCIPNIPLNPSELM